MRSPSLKTKTVAEITEQRLVLTIDKSQQVFLGDAPVNVHELAKKLQDRGVDPTTQVIYLRADENVPFGAFAAVMDAVKQAGITNVSIARSRWKPSASGRLWEPAGERPDPSTHHPQTEKRLGPRFAQDDSIGRRETQDDRGL